MTQYPSWMHRLVEVDTERRDEEAEIARLEALAEAAHQRLLGAALVEALAFVLDVALPAPETNEVILDGVHFWLNEGDVEPITDRDDDGAPRCWRFTLHVEPKLPTVIPHERQSFTFAQGDFPVPDLHCDRLRSLAAYLIRLIDEMRLAAAVSGREVRDLLADMRRADALRAAEAAERVAIDFEISSYADAAHILRAAMEHSHADDLAAIRAYLLPA